MYYQQQMNYKIANMCSNCAFHKMVKKTIMFTDVELITCTHNNELVDEDGVCDGHKPWEINL